MRRFNPLSLIKIGNHLKMKRTLILIIISFLFSPILLCSLSSNPTFAIKKMDVIAASSDTTADGILKFEIEGGKPPYKYAFGDNLKGEIDSTTLVFDKLKNGNEYWIVIIDSNKKMTSKLNIVIPIKKY